MKNKNFLAEQIQLNVTLQVLPDMYFLDQFLLESNNAELLQLKPSNLEPKIETDFHLLLELDDQLISADKIAFNSQSLKKEKENAYFNHFELHQEKAVPLMLSEIPNSLSYLDSVATPPKTLKPTTSKYLVSRFE
jgi:hypothetical protein